MKSFIVSPNFYQNKKYNDNNAVNLISTNTCYSMDGSIITFRHNEDTKYTKNCLLSEFELEPEIKSLPYLSNLSSQKKNNNKKIAKNLNIKKSKPDNNSNNCFRPTLKTTKKCSFDSNREYTTTKSNKNQLNKSNCNSCKSNTIEYEDTSTTIKIKVNYLGDYEIKLK